MFPDLLATDFEQKRRNIRELTLPEKQDRDQLLLYLKRRKGVNE